MDSFYALISENELLDLFTPISVQVLEMRVVKPLSELTDGMTR